MMEYRETGLPQNDMTVLKAYMTYVKNAKGLTEETGLSEDFGIRIAQAINATAGADSHLLSLALLSTTPQSVWGVFERSFGKELVDQMQEYAKHARTGNAYIDQASDAVKVLTMANAIAVFEEFKKKNEKSAEALEQLEMTGMPDMNALQAALPGMIEGVMPDTGAYQKLARALADKTSCPQLETLFTEKLEEFRQQQQEQQEKLARFGIIVTGPGMGPLGATTGAEPPSFEETGLLDDPKVRTAYEMMANHPRVIQPEFESAVETAKLLSTLPASKNPTAIAAALVEMSLRDRTPDDLEFMEKKLDWDVTELMKGFSLRRTTPQQMDAAPVEVKQIIVASMTAQIDRLRNRVGGMLDEVDGLQLPDGLPAELQLPPELKQMMEMRALQQMQGVANLAQKAVGPLLGKTDAPELDAAFREKVKELQDYINEKTPKTPKLLPPGPKADFRRKPGNDFSF